MTVDPEIPAFLADLLDSGGDEDTDDATRSAIAALDASDSFVTVSKLDDHAKGWGYCCRVATEVFEPFQIAETYGPGRYRFSFRRANGQIAATLQRSFCAPKSMRPAGPGMGPAAAGPDSRLAELERRIEADRAHQVGFMETLLSSLLARETGRSGSDLDVIAILREGRESAASQTPPHSLMMDAIRMGTDIAGLTKSAGPDPGDGGNVSVLERLAPRVLDLLERGLPTGANAEAAGYKIGRVAGATLAGAATAGVPAPGFPPSGDPIAAVIRQYSPHLIREAKAGHNPTLWAHWLWERTPDTWQEPLLKLAYADDLARRRLIAEIEPALEPYGQWIEQVCLTLVEITSDDDDDEERRPTAAPPAAAPAPLRTVATAGEGPRVDEPNPTAG